MNIVSHRSISPHAIVLDLDETLVHTFTNIDQAIEYGIFTDPELRSRSYYIELTDVSIEKGVGEKTRLWGVVRPYVKEFLSFCFTYFRVVGVWSAGKKDYVEAIVDLLFRDLSCPNFVYTFDDCYKEGLNYSKPLEKLYQETNIGAFVPKNNILCLDDRDDVCRHNIHNAIIIPPYQPESLQEIKQEDQALKNLMIWLSRSDVRYAEDVRAVAKNIF
ncbi:DNA-directed RNA Pol II C-term-like phosphatase [Cedratvirus kamchatka]|uniref:DNA-directed RNA Pol II C-term-like phosphatase n=1 Tax=Cedratvirus kamchatka TaxID=2716914 RepID=A0A6G8MXE2_9VIRU|nr:DNA-directed RNA Pol II C-term-like phosphatase [Cedratvirus kamchatka]